MLQESGFVKGRVSVVTPVYNGEEYLARLLDSVLLQSWDQMEMIVVDDGSEDETLQVARGYEKKFRERGFEYKIIAAEHQNASGAINHGLQKVTGEYLIWPDSDDALERESVEKRVGFLQENPQYQCVRSLSRYVDEAGKPVKMGEQRGDLSEEELFFSVLFGKTFTCCGCYMLRTEYLFQIYPDRKIPVYDVGQNFQLLLPFLYFHRCPTIQEELYVVYVRKGSHSRQRRSRQEEEKRYQDFEDLLDEVAVLCRIKDKRKLRRLELWKQKRRYELAWKYRDMRKAMAALFHIYICHGLPPWKTIKEFIKLLGVLYMMRRCEKGRGKVTKS